MKRACREVGKTQGPICRCCSSSSESRAVGLLRSCFIATHHLLKVVLSRQRGHLEALREWERHGSSHGRSDGSSPYRDGQMRLRGGREKLAMPITATVLQNKTKRSTDCSGSSSLRQKGLCMALVPLLTGSTAPHHNTRTGREETSNIPSLLFSM